MNTKFETDVKLALSIQNSVKEITEAVGCVAEDYNALIEEKLEKIRKQLRAEIIDPFMESAASFTKELRGAGRKIPRVGGYDPETLPGISGAE